MKLKNSPKENAYVKFVLSHRYCLTKTQEEIIKPLLPAPSRQETGFTVLANTDMPAVLVETAFIDNPHDANLLKERKDFFTTTFKL